jgi:hypothetical protein
MAEIEIVDRNKIVVGIALVDDTDYDLVSGFGWSLDKVTGYVTSTILHPLGGFRNDGRKRRLNVRMHTIILGLQYGDGLRGDHIDHNKLDNRRENLRLVTHAENMQNQSSTRNSSSGYRGVSWDSNTGKWRARCVFGGMAYRLGSYWTEEEAHEVISTWRREHVPFAVEVVSSDR